MPFTSLTIEYGHHEHLERHSTIDDSTLSDLNHPSLPGPVQEQATMRIYKLTKGRFVDGHSKRSYQVDASSIETCPGISVSYCRTPGLMKDSLLIHVDNSMLMMVVSKSIKNLVTRPNTTYNGFISHRGRHILTTQNDSEGPLIVIAQLGEQGTDPVQIEHGQTYHAFICFFCL